MVGKIRIVYEFTVSLENAHRFDIYLDEDTVTYHAEKGIMYPSWTKLQCEQCDHCPLDGMKSLRCPIAQNLSHVADSFKDTISHKDVMIKVGTAQRLYLKKSTVQEGLFSIFGLIMATSGCPHMSFLKPMARFHLPFSTLEETMVRSLSFYVLRQLFEHRKGNKADFELTEFDKLYENVHKVNAGIINRIKTLGKGDAEPNALLILDSFATLLGDQLKSNLEDIEKLVKVI
jgi:hypothetical protein